MPATPNATASANTLQVSVKTELSSQQTQEILNLTIPGIFLVKIKARLDKHETNF